MALLDLDKVGSYLAFDEAQCRAVGRSLANEYQSASPFPHIVLDDFLDGDVLRSLVGAFPSSQDKTCFDRDQERLKYQYHPSESPAPWVRNLLAELNGQALLGFLEEMTGIGGLVSDPYFSGGGLHETRRGGHLGVHADFNLHDKMKLERRLNLLIYLNEDWPDEYGGKLELWAKDMKTCEVQVAPILGRAVIFSTALDSYHGHPDPLKCPPDRTRRSIATYYYTALEAGLETIPDRVTNFRPRPGTSDPTDWAVRWEHFLRDWVPPAARRIARRLK
jgi:Rps23 Pro-64 3,4-dihydroxylase Tpa1-like proline 4-hydroxylase